MMMMMMMMRVRMFERSVMVRRSGPNREDATGGWRKLHNKELHNLYCSLNIIRVKKSRRVKWAGQVARMEDRRNTYRIFVTNLKRRDHLETLDVDGRFNFRTDFRETGCEAVGWIRWFLMRASGGLLQTRL
jgi:hypothetical protein